MAEKIVVSVRVRPLSAREEARGTAWDVDDIKHAITPKVRRGKRNSCNSFTFPKRGEQRKAKRVRACACAVCVRAAEMAG